MNARILGPPRFRKDEEILLSKHTFRNGRVARDATAYSILKMQDRCDESLVFYLLISNFKFVNAEKMFKCWNIDIL